MRACETHSECSRSSDLGHGLAHSYPVCSHFVLTHPQSQVSLSSTRDCRLAAHGTEDVAGKGLWPFKPLALGVCLSLSASHSWRLKGCQFLQCTQTFGVKRPYLFWNYRKKGIRKNWRVRYLWNLSFSNGLIFGLCLHSLFSCALKWR